MLTMRVPGTFVEAVVADQRIRFFVHNPADVIQSHHLNGEFYEVEELALMSKYMTAQTRYLDVGANVGNHVLYLCRILGLRQVTVVEPNGPAMALLRINLALNDLQDRVDVSCLGYGLSDQAGQGDMTTHRDNLGGARFVEFGSGPFQLSTGDALLGDRDFDFIKIDTEGMEMRCLRGLEGLIRRCRPALFVEVDNANVAAFLQWCAEHGYLVRETFRRYIDNENYLVTPA